jgi:Flp pilus assembly pilin Flp
MTKPTLESGATSAAIAASAVGASTPTLTTRLRLPGLLRDQRGISTAEYAVMFVVVCIGTLGAWKALSKSVNSQLSNGTDSFNSALNASRANNEANANAATQGWTQSQAAAPSNAQAAPASANGASVGQALGNTQAPSQAMAGQQIANQPVGNDQAMANQQQQAMGLGSAQAVATGQGNGQAQANQQQAAAATDNQKAFNDAQAIQQQANAAATHNKSRGDKSPDDQALKGNVKGDIMDNPSSATGPKTPNDRAANTPATNKGDVKADFQDPQAVAAPGAKGEVKADLATTPTAAPGAKTEGHEASTAAPNKGGRR